MGSCALPQSSWEHWTAPASIRSLDVLNDEEARYAGSDGWIGQFSGETNTWEHRQLTAPDGRTPSFRSSSYAGEKWFAASIESPAWILQTSSNGWAPNWVHHDTSAAVFLDAMAWWDDKEGMVFGDPIDGCIHLLMTRDAGETWSAVSCDHLPPSMEGEAGFAASNGNVCIQGDTAWVFTGGLSSRVFRTLDRGMTWNVYKLPVIQGGAMTGVFGAEFASSLRGMAIGGDWEHPDINVGNIIATDDGGATWRRVADGDGPGYRSCIVHHPIHPEQIVAVGFQGLDISLNGGQSWEHVSDSSSFVARFSPSGRTLWLAGNQSLSKVDWPLPQRP